jgi:hypothetical protein
VYVYHPESGVVKAFFVENSREPEYFIRASIEIDGDPQVKQAIQAFVQWTIDWEDKTVTADDVGLDYESAWELVGNPYAWQLTQSRAGVYASSRLSSKLSMLFDSVITSNEVSRMLSDMSQGASLTVVFRDGMKAVLQRTAVNNRIDDSGADIFFEIKELRDGEDVLMPTSAETLRYYSVSDRSAAFVQNLLTAARRLGIRIGVRGQSTGDGSVVMGELFIIECNGEECEAIPVEQAGE